MSGCPVSLSLPLQAIYWTDYISHSKLWLMQSFLLCSWQWEDNSNVFKNFRMEKSCHLELCMWWKSRFLSHLTCLGFSFCPMYMRITSAVGPGHVAPLSSLGVNPVSSWLYLANSIGHISPSLYSVFSTENTQAMIWKDIYSKPQQPLEWVLQGPLASSIVIWNKKPTGRVGEASSHSSEIISH